MAKRSTSTPTSTVPAPAPTPAEKPKTHGAANFLLARLPWFKDNYETWSQTKRNIIAFFLYLILLPIIPIVIAIVMYIHDPEGFKKSKAFPILVAIIVAQLAAFGVVSQQTPKITPATTNSASTAVVDQQAADKLAQSDKAAKERKKLNPTAVTPSNATGGKYYANCTAAFNAGVHDIVKTDPSYRLPLDGDKDGVACEK